MSIATVDDIAAGIALGQRIRYSKILSAPKGAGTFHSSWLGTGVPVAGSAPPLFSAGSGYTCDKSTTGAWLYSNGAVQNWLARLSAAATQPMTIYLSDRLWSCSGMGFAALTYTVTTPGSLPARITDNGVGCELWIENFVATGLTAGTITVNYLDPSGNAHTGVFTPNASTENIGSMQQCPLQSGDTGIKQLTSVVNSASWISGTWGMTILKPIAEIYVSQIGVTNILDWATVLAKIPADACLFAHILAQNATAPLITGTAMVIDK